MSDWPAIVHTGLVTVSASQSVWLAAVFSAVCTATVGAVAKRAVETERPAGGSGSKRITLATTAFARRLVAKASATKPGALVCGRNERPPGSDDVTTRFSTLASRWRASASPPQPG